MNISIDCASTAAKLRNMGEGSDGTVVLSTRIPDEVGQGLSLLAALNGIKRSDILRMAMIEWLEFRAAQDAMVAYER